MVYCSSRIAAIRPPLASMGCKKMIFRADLALVPLLLGTAAAQGLEGGQLVGRQRTGRLVGVHILRMAGVEVNAHIPVKTVQLCSSTEDCLNLCYHFERTDPFGSCVQQKLTADLDQRMPIVCLFLYKFISVHFFSSFQTVSSFQFILLKNRTAFYFFPIYL